MSSTIDSRYSSRITSEREARSRSHTKTVQIAWIAFLAVVVLATLPALISRLINGISTTDLTSMVPWGAWVAMYIFCVGLSAGSFVVSTLDYVFGLRGFHNITKPALLASMLSLGVGLVFIGLDIGRWDRAFNAVLHFHWTSPLSWAVRFYIIFIIIEVALFVIVMMNEHGKIRDERGASSWMKGLGIAGLFIAIFGVLGSEGALFAIVEARPLWFGGLFPVIITVSAIVSGIALVSVLYYVPTKLSGTPIDQRLMRTLGGMLATALAIDLLLTFFEYAVPFFANEPAALEAISIQATGPYWWIFWVVQLAIGMVLPLVLMISPLRRTPKVVAIAGVLTIIGIVALRFNIVVPAQIPPVIGGFPVADYFPTLSEFAICACLVAGGLLVYTLIAMWQPIYEFSSRGDRLESSRWYEGEEL